MNLEGKLSLGVYTDGIPYDRFASVAAFERMIGHRVEYVLWFHVPFLWSAMWLNSWGNQYYPGDDVVDWIGTTVLNHGTGAIADWARWQSFYELFDGQYQAAAGWGKPIMLTEWLQQNRGETNLLGRKFQLHRPTPGPVLPSAGWSVFVNGKSLVVEA